MIEAADGENLIIKINDKECEITPKISTSDIFMIEEVENLEECDYNLLIAKSVANKSKGIFTPEEIVDANDIINQYINILVRTNNVIKELYDRFDDEEDKKKRFVLAWAESRNVYLKKLSDSIKGIEIPSVTIPDYSSLVQPAIDMKNKIASITEPILRMTEHINAIMNSSMNGVYAALNRIVDIYQQSIPNYTQIFNNITNTIQRVLENITIPTITEERKKELLESYKIWGNYGWTVPIEAEFNLFNNPPKDEKEAYAIIRAYTKDVNMQNLFEQLEDTKHIRKADLSEAISCYDSKNYKACAMLLFSMIDARLIRLQKDEDRDRRNMRKSGSGAAKKLFERMEREDPERILLYELLWRQNIMSAINAVFANGDDFKQQPSIINRNFLDHGMLHRYVRKKDCIMLFLLLYNLYQLLNSTDSI